MKQYISLTTPLNGINTYKDTLNLETGATTRQIKKLVLTGQENGWRLTGSGRMALAFITAQNPLRNIQCVCSHYKGTAVTAYGDLSNGECTVSTMNGNNSELGIYDTNYTTLADFKTYLQQQYGTDTPVTVWYVLSTPTTSTTTLPRGLSGTVEGYLTQSSTPSPSSPVYPTANSIDAFLDKKYLEYGTEADTITTLPKTIIADGTSATATIKGNLSQSGTPTPSSPIYPSETGNKTANLCNESTLQNGYFGTLSGFPYTADDKYRCFSMELSAGTYTIFAKSNDVIIRLLRVSSASLGANAVNKDNQAYTFTLSATETIYVSMRNSTTTNNFTGLTIMLNDGSTALPYDIYGYKIPILSGGTTTPVYLGEVQSERQIAKYEFTGQETFSTSGSGYNVNIRDAIGVEQTVTTDAICSHYQAQRYDKVYSGTAFGFAQRLGATENNRGFSFSKGDYETLTDFKTYLQQQYSNGTPVTVWYVLATPTTTTLNEPLRKIGTYADSISNVTQIPTTSGSQTFDVQTDLKPSEVDLTYHGWHEHEPKEYSGGSWT